MNKLITTDNIFEELLHADDGGAFIFTTHLDILGDSILQLDPRKKPHALTMLHATVIGMRDYIQNMDIVDIVQLEPFVRLWMRLIHSDSDIMWNVCMKELPKRLTDRINVLSMYELGQSNINIFGLDIVRENLSAMLLLRNDQPIELYNRYYYTDKIDYSKLLNCFDEVLAFYKKFPLARMTTAISIITDIFREEKVLDLTYDRLSVLTHAMLFFRCVEIELTPGFDFKPENYVHLKLPHGLGIRDITKCPIMDYLEYNYADLCPVDYFTKLRLYMSLQNSDTPSLADLQFVYSSCMQPTNGSIIELYPNFE